MPVAILVTDVTEMRAGNFCVAGWDSAGRRMVRPLPDGANWTSSLLTANSVLPGSAVAVEPTGASSSGSFPHKTEDLIVNRSKIKTMPAVAVNWFGAQAPPTSPSLDSAYESHLQSTGSWNNVLKGVHLPDGTRTFSLVALRLSAESLQFITNDFDASKLRVILTDDNASYNLPVVGHELLHTFRNSGVTAVQNHVKQATELHVRIGLARAWDGQPGRCFAMLNGVIW